MSHMNIPMWMPERTRRWALVACCPTCGTPDVRVASRRNKRVRYLRCQDCGKMWKDVSDDGVCKSYVVGGTGK
jgi:transposase-like protein